MVADVECCICFKQKSLKTGGYEQLTKCTTEDSANALKLYASSRNCNEILRAYTSGVEWENIVAIELHYHRSCYRDVSRPKRNSGYNQQSPIYNKIQEFVDVHVTKKLEIVTLETLKY